MAAAETAKKRRKKRKKRKKQPAQQAPAQQPQTPPPPPKYKHTLGWDDSAGDGLVREIFEWVDQPPTDTPPPRPLPVPQDPPAPKLPQPMGVYSGNFGRVQATRLLNRAGFGPKPGQALEFAAKGLQNAVYTLTRPSGNPNLIGPEPTDDDGLALAPLDAYGHDHLWWLDRMVRSDQQLVERMALTLHDWFATSNDKVDNRQLMINQTSLFRSSAFGSFKTLLEQITIDPAMLLWLDGVENRRGRPNENYAREVMELFALGADRGAYTENDVRELARALTGWTYDWTSELGAHNFRFVSGRFDNTNKTVFGQTGNWRYSDVGTLCVQLNPKHAEFFVLKLWSYFIPQPPSDDTKAALISLYNSNGYAIRPVLEAILMHPDFYEGPAMVKPPVVYVASLLRASGTFIHSEDWYWLASYMGQQLFYPPNVSGWDDNRWLDTNTTRGRWLNAYAVLSDHAVDNWDGSYSPAETPEPALDSALAIWDYPPLRKEQHNELLRFAQNAFPGSVAQWQQIAYRAERQNALRQLIASCPDLQLS